VSVYNIRQIELQYWMKTFKTITTESALFAGFCFGGLVINIEESTPVLNMAYLTSTCMAMGFGLLAITIASICLMMGPGKSLRGKTPEDVDKAVDMLKDKSFECFNYFILELLFFHISSFLLMWIYYRFIVALVVNIVLGIFLLFFIKNGLDITQQLYIENDDAVSGKFDTLKGKLPNLSEPGKKSAGEKNMPY
jgi:hypothetical protein